MIGFFAKAGVIATAVAGAIAVVGAIVAGIVMAVKRKKAAAQSLSQ